MPIPSLEDTGYWTTDEALDAAEVPASIIVLGGGATAVEFATYYGGLGRRVTLIQRSSQLLRALSTSNGRAHTIGQMEVLLGSWRAMLDLPDRYASITAADVLRVAQKTFAPHRRNLVTLVPGEVDA